MDKIFECNIIKQDSILCKFQSNVLLDILKFLRPTDIVRMSHTCKELHRKLPFYLIKRDNFAIAVLNKKYLAVLFEGPAINYSVSKINVSINHGNCLGLLDDMLIQIIRCGEVVMEIQRILLDIEGTYFRFQFKIYNDIIREVKPGDRTRFMASIPYAKIKSSIFGDFLISFQIKNYKYGKPLYTAKKVMGYAKFKSPLVLVETPKFVDQSSKRIDLPEAGDT